MLDALWPILVTVVLILALIGAWAIYEIVKWLFFSKSLFDD